MRSSQTIGEEMPRGSGDDFVESARFRLRCAGISDAELWSEIPANPAGFGDSAVIFRVDSFLLRILRDRGQFFLDLATAARPNEFHLLDDVNVFLGFTTIAEVLSRDEPEDVRVALTRIAENRAIYATAFDSGHANESADNIAHVAAERAELFLKRLRGVEG